MASSATAKRLTQARASVRQQLSKVKREEKAVRKRKRDLARKLEQLEAQCRAHGITLIKESQSR